MCDHGVYLLEYTGHHLFAYLTACIQSQHALFTPYTVTSALPIRVKTQAGRNSYLML